jgi:hypothetical protein
LDHHRTGQRLFFTRHRDGRFVPTQQRDGHAQQIGFVLAVLERLINRSDHLRQGWIPLSASAYRPSRLLPCHIASQQPYVGQTFRLVGTAAP